MVRTDQAYINQYLVYDEVFEACEACEKACVEADYFLRKEARKSYLDTYFSEALNFGAKKAAPAKEESNIFAKIGKAIVTLIEKIKAAIKHITESILGTQRRTEKANKDLQKILAENPEMKKTIMKGLKKEWFTVYDVASYKNDVVGLIKMVDQAKIDNATAMDKLKEAGEKFKKGAIASGAIGFGIGSALKVVTEINKQRKALGEMITDFQKLCEQKKEEAEKQGKPSNIITTSVRILTSAVQVALGIDRTCENNAKNASEAVEQAASPKKKTQSQEVHDQIKDDADKAVNSYYGFVERFVRKALNVSSDKDPGYTNVRGLCSDSYNRIKAHYADYVDGLDDGKFNSFKTEVDNIANHHGNIKDIEIKDAINDGKFIRTKK